MQQPATALRTQQQLRTLVIEPETEARQLLELALSVRGQDVTACADAASARAAFTLERFPLVIVNRTTPDGDAIDLVSELRADDRYRDTAIVVISGIATDEDRDRLLAVGANDYIPWPADTDLLRERFDNAERIAFDALLPTPPAASQREPFLVLAPDGTIRQASAASEPLLGFPPAATIGVNAFTFIDPADAPSVLSMVVEAFTRPSGSRQRVIRVRRDADTWREVSLSALTTTDDAHQGGIALYLQERDARTAGVDDATRTALHDAVTNLPNRTLFLDRIDHAVARATRKGLPVVVVTVDFNDFAATDDIDDGLINVLADRLRDCLRTSDTAARLGHDEFGLLLEEIVDLDNVRIVADRVVEAMQEPFIEGEAEVTLTPNIGIAVSSPTRSRAVDLLRDSTAARTWARVQGSGQYVMFDETMSVGAESTLSASAEARPTASAPAASPRFEVGEIDTRFDELQDRLDTLEELIRSLGRQ
jgi:diguanylate cyclase (GGDEF)-like protein